MTRRDLFRAVFGLPAVGAPATGFALSGPLRLSQAAENEVEIGTVTLTLHDPVLLGHARDLIEYECCLSLTRGHCR